MNGSDRRIRGLGEVSNAISADRQLLDVPVETTVEVRAPATV